MCDAEQTGLAHDLFQPPTALQLTAIQAVDFLHPAERRIGGDHGAGDWVSIETPEGSVRAQVRLNESLDPRVVVGEQVVRACRSSALGRHNLLIGTKAVDLVSGTGIAPLVSMRDPAGRPCLKHP